MIIIIDRFEGDFALVELENMEIIKIPRKLVPENAKEGDILEIRIDQEATKKRQEEVKGKFKDLFLNKKDNQKAPSYKDIKRFRK